jgi:opacity protein-like surface antigen
MKQLTLTLCALTALVSAAYAGTQTYSSKEVHTPPPCPTWYADTEWNIGISGIYAPFTDRDVDTDRDFDQDLNFFGPDDAWGGALDVKYFFHRNYGVGIQGFILGLDTNDNNQFVRDNDNDWAGAILGTFTFRYPIPCSRFAPYGWLGAGAIWNVGGDFRSDTIFEDDGELVTFEDRKDDAHFIGQAGIGFEVRFTPHVGWTNDVSYNYVDGSHNDFFQIRTGLNFAF